MEFKYNKSIYSKVVIIKAAYHYTDVAYVHLDCDDDYYKVILEAKNGAEKVDEKSFDNEVLAQVARYEVFQQTKNIRELSLARALASSVVEKSQEVDTSDLPDNCAEDILKDWFDDEE